MLDVKLDLTESVNKTAIATFEEPAKSTGALGKTAIDFIHNLLLYPMQKYNIYAEYKLNAFKQSLEDSIKQIPEDKRTDPNISIWGNACDSLKWNLDEEHIKNAFVDILMADINKDTKSTVVPAFIEVIKQLSSADAQFIHSHFKGGNGGIELFDICINLIIQPGHPALKSTLPYAYEHGVNSVNHDFFVKYQKDKVAEKIDDIVIDNLERLKLIEISDGFYSFAAQAEIDKYFEEVLAQFGKSREVNTQTRYIYKRKMVKPTAFGKNFMKIVRK